MLHDLKTIADKQAHELAVLVRLTPEAMPGEMRAIIRAKHHREVITASLAARFPSLASDVCNLVNADRGDVALDMIGEAIATLQNEDPILFAGIPTREEMLKLAIAALPDMAANDQTRRSLWVNFADVSDERRLRDGYKFKHQIAASGATKRATMPNRTRDGGLVDGGTHAQVAVERASDEGSV